MVLFKTMKVLVTCIKLRYLDLFLVYYITLLREL